MIKNITYSALISLICVASLYTMDEPFMCKVPQKDSEIAEIIREERGYKELADRWHWNVDIEQAGRLSRLRERFGEVHNLVELHPVIEREVHKALKACNITEPVLVLQNENSTNSACYPLVDEWYYPVKAMSVGIADKQEDAPLTHIRHTIFHECGHIVAGDVEQNSKDNLLKNLSFIVTFSGVATYTGIRAAKALHAYPKSVRILGGIGAGFTGLFALGRLYHKTIHAYVQRKKECNAEIFAAQKLVKLQDYGTLTYTFLNKIYHHDARMANGANEYWLFHDHPGYFEQARIILDELKKAGVDFNNLPIDENEYSDKHEMQQKFTQQVKKYFPEYLNT